MLSMFHFFLVAHRFSCYIFLCQCLFVTYLMNICRMHRNKGQFTSSKKQDGANSYGTDQDSGQDDSQSETS